MMDLHPYLEPHTLPSTKMWYVLATSGEHPTLRVGHASIYIPDDGQSNGHLYVTGGANPSGTFTDTFCLDLDSFAWQKYPAAGFAGRYEHTVFRGQSNPTKFYVFGGADCNGNRNDIQEFDIATRTWRTLEATGPAPSPRTFHNGACIENRLIVYGGGDRGTEPVSDKNTYAFDITEKCWSVLKLRGDAPKPRHGHLMLAVGNRLFLHGGMSGSLFFDDLHLLDLDKNSWSCAKVKSVKPARRAAHGGFVSGTDIFVFGGMNSTGALNDIFTMNTNTMQWSAVELCGSAPECRLDFAACTVRLRRSTEASTVSSTASLHPEQTDSSSASQSTADQRSGTHIIDVTSQFVGSPDIIDVSTHAGSSDAECCSSPEPVPVSAPQADAEVLGLSEAIAGIRVPDDPVAGASLPDVEVALVLGGMDTAGEIFDDCLVFRLTTSM